MDLFLPKTDWSKFIFEETKKPYFNEIINKIKNEKNHIFPKPELIFRCFNFFNINELKVVIFGQDPYHTKGVADGLAFSTSNKKTPPSLRNILKLLGKKENCNNDLSNWAKQGVLLVNTSLTVIESKPNSHSKIGWSNFIENMIDFIDKNCENIVYILLGKESQKLEIKIKNRTSKILKTSHPSPLSCSKGFFESDIFNKANELIKNKINW